jgi:hypothetical protein
MDPATMNDSPAAMVDRLARTTNAHDLDGLVDCFAVDYRNEPQRTRPGVSPAGSRSAATGSRSSRPCRIYRR